MTNCDLFYSSYLKDIQLHQTDVISEYSKALVIHHVSLSLILIETVYGIFKVYDTLLTLKYGVNLLYICDHIKGIASKVIKWDLCTQFRLSHNQGPNCQKMMLHFGPESLHTFFASFNVTNQ